MGGREFAEAAGDAVGKSASAADVARVLEEHIMLFPSVSKGSGPFPTREARWSHAETAFGPASRLVAVSFYLALMTAECLNLAGARGPSIIEGPFAANRHFLDMLSAATGRPVVVAAESETGTSIGAALLTQMSPQTLHQQPAATAFGSAAHTGYAQRWRSALGA
jgi:sugar (pentulose or hexulose) kinase